MATHRITRVKATNTACDHCGAQRTASWCTRSTCPRFKGELHKCRVATPSQCHGLTPFVICRYHFFKGDHCKRCAGQLYNKRCVTCNQPPARHLLPKNHGLLASDVFSLQSQVTLPHHDMPTGCNCSQCCSESTSMDIS